MPNPTYGEFHSDKTLTDMSVAIMGDERGFVADLFAPAVPVLESSGNYVVFNDGDFNRDEMAPRAPSTESEGSGYSLSRDPYSIVRYAVHKDTDYVDAAQADEVLDPEGESNLFVTRKALIKREVLFNAAVLGQTAPGGAGFSYLAKGVASSPTADASFDPTDTGNTNNKVLQWSDPSSKPLHDLSRGRIFLAQSGLRANTGLCTLDVFEALARHPDILDLLAGGATVGNPAIATEELLAKILHVDRLLVMSGIKNAAAKGQAKDNQFIASGIMLLAHVAPNPGKFTPSAVYTMTLRNPGVDGLSAKGTRLQRLELPTQTSFRVEIEQYVAPKIVAPSLGYLFSGLTP
jgi:hypothetical protein